VKKKERVLNLSNNKIDEIYHNIYFKYKKSFKCYNYYFSKEIKKSVAYYIFNSIKVIQWT